MRKIYQNLMNTEPARLFAGVAATLIILVNVAAYFLPQFDGESAAVLTGAISAILAVIAGEGTRRNVTPWNAGNQNALYPEDLTGYEPGAAASKKQASE